MELSRRLAICTTSIATLLTASPESPGNNFNVLRGDTSTVAGTVPGDNGLTKTGGGTLTLTNAANDYTGPTTISNGSVVLSSGSALGVDHSAIVVA
jgi:autotransporter-associated beta strand protein